MLPPNVISGPVYTVAAVGDAVSVTFDGVNLASGDFAKWVDIEETSCEGEAAALSSVSDGTASFTFSSYGLRQLCYKWNYRDSTYDPSAFTLFSGIQAAVMQVDGVRKKRHREP